MAILKKGGLAGVFSIHSLQVESIFPAAHNEEKVKRTFLCLLCSYVKKDLFRSTLKLLSEPPTYVLMSKRTYLGHNTKC